MRLTLSKSNLGVIYLRKGNLLRTSAKRRNIAVSKNQLKHRNYEPGNITTVRQGLRRSHSRQSFHFRGQGILERGDRHYRHGGLFRLIGSGSSRSLLPPSQAERGALHRLERRGNLHLGWQRGSRAIWQCRADRSRCEPLHEVYE